jgi:hypothetical protein
MNYRHTWSIPALRLRLPGLPFFLAPNKKEEKCQDR